MKGYRVPTCTGKAGNMRGFSSQGKLGETIILKMYLESMKTFVFEHNFVED